MAQQIPMSEHFGAGVPLDYGAIELDPTLAIVNTMLLGLCDGSQPVPGWSTEGSSIDGKGSGRQIEPLRERLQVILAELFVASFVLHLCGSHQTAAAEAALDGTPQHSLIAHLWGMGFGSNPSRTGKRSFLLRPRWLSCSLCCSWAARWSRSV
jgi:hypothetical protein